MTNVAHDSGRNERQAVFAKSVDMPGTVNLKVVSGAHDGAVFPVKLDRVSVGSALDNDVVLFAADLSPHHFRIELANRFSGKAIVHAVDEPVLVNDDQWVEVGHSLNARMPLKIHAGGADMVLDAPRGWLGPLKLLLGLLALALVLFIGVPMVQRMLSPTIAQIGRVGDIGASIPAAEGGATDQGAVAALRARVQAAGLGGLVQIADGKGGSVVASGVVDDGRIGLWRDIVKWYDMQPQAPLLVNTVSRSNAIAGPQGIKSIWIDKNPQVLLQNGATAGKGDTIPGGWVIEQIDASGVTLTRDGMTQKIQFQ